jgi:hypothetical protein
LSGKLEVAYPFNGLLWGNGLQIRHKTTSRQHNKTKQNQPGV